MFWARAIGIWLASVSALCCAPRVVFSVPAGDPAYDGAGISRLVVGPGGDLWVVGGVRSIVPTSWFAHIASAPFVTRLDPAGNVRWRTVLGEASELGMGPTAVAVDGAGNAFVVGQGPLSGSQILNGVARPLPSPWRFGRGSVVPSTGWLAKLDPGGQVLAYGLFGCSMGALPQDIALDASGSPVVVGNTTDPDFPTPPGAVGGPPRQPGLAWCTYSFVMRLLPDARSVVFSTCLGGTEWPCVGGSWCVGIGAHTGGNAVVVDGKGNIYVAGSSSATDFLPDTWQLGGGYLMVISADGSRLSSATRMAVAPEPGAMRLTSTGQLVMGATTWSGGLPTTPGVSQSEFRGCPPGQYPLCYHGGCVCRFSNGYVFEVHANGRLVRATYLGGQSATVGHLALDAGGNIWISGDKAGDDFPDTPGGLGRGGEFLMKLERDTFALAQAVRLPGGVGYGSIAFGSNGGLYIGAGSGLVSRVALDSSGPAILGVASAAAWSQVTGEVVPGELVGVYGREIGPPEPLYLELDAEGRVGTDLGGSRLFFQGLAAPLLYAQRDQINAVVPFAVAGMPEVNVELMQADKVVATQKVHVVDTRPVIWGLLNPDGSPNSERRPASKGSVVSVYAAGFGDLLPRPADGEVPTTVLGKPKAPVTVLLDAKPAEVLYIGSAPGLVAGVMQVNFRVPDCRQCELVLKVGTRATYVSLYVVP
jgi:uncharacterized protein (TIGR03437 family)